MRAFTVYVSVYFKGYLLASCYMIRVWGQAGFELASCYMIRVWGQAGFELKTFG